MVTRAAGILGGGAVAAALGWLVGAALGEPTEPPASSAAEMRQPDCEARLHEIRPRIAEVGARPREAPEVEGLTWAECRQQGLEAEARRARQLRADLVGRASADADPPPLAWAAPPPYELTESGFRELLERAVAECGADAEVATVDCSEPPCVAALTTLDTSLQASDVLRCAGPLFQAGGGGFDSTAKPLWCTGDVEGRALLISPGLEAIEARGGVIAPYEGGQHHARVWRRTDALGAGLACPD